MRRLCNAGAWAKHVQPPTPPKPLRCLNPHPTPLAGEYHFCNLLPSNTNPTTHRVARASNPVLNGRATAGAGDGLGVHSALEVGAKPACRVGTAECAVPGAGVSSPTAVSQWP